MSSPDPSALAPLALGRRGLMLVLSSPSGAGKSTLARNLLRDDPNLSLSVSVTTRGRRGSEIDGKDYHFIDKERFEYLRETGGLLEWAEVHGNFYATPLEPVQQAMADGHDMLFDIDWQGTLQMMERTRADIVSVFVLPPTMAELRARLVRRAEDHPDVIDRRLAGSLKELEHYRDYDYQLVNHDLGTCFEDLKAILRAERLRGDRRIVAMSGFVDGLLEQGRKMTGEGS
ncbi:guanylate kinase [Rhizobiaceae bacterium]|nr:guanylate kinase [Rhizobiaceae bacterium]